MKSQEKTEPVERGPQQDTFGWDEIEKKSFHRRDLALETWFDNDGKVIRRRRK